MHTLKHEKKPCSSLWCSVYLSPLIVTRNLFDIDFSKRLKHVYDLKRRKHECWIVICTCFFVFPLSVVLIQGPKTKTMNKTRAWNAFVSLIIIDFRVSANPDCIIWVKIGQVHDWFGWELLLLTMRFTEAKHAHFPAEINHGCPVRFIWLLSYCHC